MNGQAMSRLEEALLSSSTPLSNFHLTVSSDLPTRNDFFITSTSNDDLRSSKDSRDRSDLSSDTNLRGSVQSTNHQHLHSMMAEHLHIYKIDPKEQARAKLLEEETQRRKDKRKHITLLENLQKMTKERLKRKGLAGGTPKAAPGGKEAIKDGIASLMRAGAASKPVLVAKKEEEVPGEPVVEQSPVKKEEVGNKNEPESGLSRLTMILRGEDPETLRKKKLMEDPEQRRLWSQMISPKSQPKSLVLQVTQSQTIFRGKKQQIYFNNHNGIKKPDSSRNFNTLQQNTSKSPGRAYNYDIEDVSYPFSTVQASPKVTPSQFRAPSTYLRDLATSQRRNIPLFPSQSPANQPQSQNFLQAPSRNSINGSKVSFLHSPSKTSLKGSFVAQPEADYISQPSSAKKRGHTIKIEKKVDDKVFVLTPQDVSDLFQAKILDLGIQFFQNQYQRFVEHCEKTCINRRLNLSDQKLGMNGAKKIAQILCRNQDKDSIAKIDLSKNNVGDQGAKHIAEALCRVQSVISLDLTSNSITSEGGAELINLLMYNYSLIDLNISSLEGLQRNTLGPAGVKPLRELLHVNHFLSILNLSGNFIGDMGVCYLGEGLKKHPINTSLKSLNLQSNDITGDGAEKLYQCLKNTGVTHLNLSKNPLKIKGAKAVGDMIMKGNDINIDVLDISECQITHPGAVFIYNGIRRCQSLDVLIMDRNKLTSKYISELSQALWMNNTLLKLSMAHCELYDDGGIYLFDGLERNLKLVELNISDNNLRFLCARRIAEVLTVKDMCVESLNLSHNALTDQGALKIINSLRSNRVLKRLDLYDNQLNDQTARALLDLLKRQSKLTHLNLGLNNFDQVVVQQITSLCAKNFERSLKSVIPGHVKQIVALNLKATRFGEIYRQIDEKEAIRCEQQTKFDRLDKKVDTFRRKSTERHTLLTEALKEYTEDTDELDREIAHLNMAEARQQKLLDRDYEEMHRRYVRERKEREMAQELVKDQWDAFRVVEYKQREEIKKYQEALVELQTRQRIAEVSYKMLLKEVHQYRPPYPSDLFRLDNNEALSFAPPRPGDFGQVEFQTSIARMKEEKAFLKVINGGEKKKKSKKTKKK